MDDQSITVRCACGWVTVGREEDVVVATIEHGLRLHNMTATREEVLAMATASDAEPATPSAPSHRTPNGL